MHSLRCCCRRRSGVLAAHWITVTVNEDTGGEDAWKNSSDLTCLSTIHFKVLGNVDSELILVAAVTNYC